jgi:hypothetical protein
MASKILENIISFCRKYYYNNFISTPKLISSPIKILFISFNGKEKKCNYCGNVYSSSFYQKYCESCLITYLENSINYVIYLDVLRTHKLNELEGVLFLKQILPHDNELSENEENCGELIYEQIPIESNPCSNFYKISFECVESTLMKKVIPIIYLPWWDAYNQCIICNKFLEFGYDCQKWCSSCLIFYTGCRYCLATIIIFGITNKSQCKKCKRIITIPITTSYNTSGNPDIDEFLYFANFDYNYIDYEINNYINNIDKRSNPLDIYDFIRVKFNYLSLKPKIEWISYSQIKDLEQIAEGGFGIVYKALINENIVVIKKIFNSQNPDKDFLNEVMLKNFNDKIPK